MTGAGRGRTRWTCARRHRWSLAAHARWADMRAAGPLRVSLGQSQTSLSSLLRTPRADMKRTCRIGRLIPAAEPAPFRQAGRWC